MSPVGVCHVGDGPTRPSIDTIMETVVSFVSAGLFFLIMNHRELKALVKQLDQRTNLEKSQVESGLARTLALEFFLLVPASVALVVLMLPLILRMPYAGPLNTLARGPVEDRLALRTVLGIASYGFPFAALRERVGRALGGLFTTPAQADAPEPSHHVAVRRND
ncbi:MAG TPA: hypothetical protein VEO19_02670 [Terriglobia bacterium]|nr:hypothetical protein [Terriglobia bacterium]